LIKKVLTLLFGHQVDHVEVAVPDAAPVPVLTLSPREEEAILKNGVPEDDENAIELALFREEDGDGFLCMDKVMTVQEIVYEEEVSKICHCH
jgi:hypothetical protein